MENIKSDKVRTFLCLIIIVLVVFGSIITYLYLDIKNKNLNSQTDNLEKTVLNECNIDCNDFKGLSGLYSFISDDYEIEHNRVNERYYLLLNENGTFIYKINRMFTSSSLGNYTIKDNKILLNVLFYSGNGTGVTVNNKEKIVEIQKGENNSLIDIENSIEELNLSSIILTKSTVQEKNEFSNTNDFHYLLNNSQLINNFEE